MFDLYTFSAVFIGVIIGHFIFEGGARTLTKWGLNLRAHIDSTSAVYTATYFTELICIVSFGIASYLNDVPPMITFGVLVLYQRAIRIEYDLSNNGDADA